MKPKSGVKSCVKLMFPSGTVTFHFTHIRVWIGDHSYELGHLYPLLENTVTLIMENIDNEIDLVIKQLSFNTHIGLDGLFPRQVIGSDTCLANNLDVGNAPS